MKRLLVFLLLASCSAAQDRSAAVPVPASCGPAGIRFGVKPDKNRHTLVQPESGKALVYVIEEFEEAQGGFITPTIRIGLNGAWVGATQGASFLFFSVDPGEQHLCANWQSSSSRIANKYSLASFTAESGKVYFFKVAPRLQSYHDRDNVWRKDLAPVDRDAAIYLMEISSLSVFHLKK